MQTALPTNISANSGWFPKGDSFVFAPTQATFPYDQNYALPRQAEHTSQVGCDINQYFDFDAAS
jgi:hypothetical protein